MCRSAGNGSRHRQLSVGGTSATGPATQPRVGRRSARLLLGARAAWEKITADPRTRTDRQHPLKGSLGTRTVNGDDMEQWQYEVTGGGRLWYVIDDKNKTVWLTEAMPGHPKATE